MKKLFITLFVALVVNSTMAFAVTQDEDHSIHLLGKLEANLYESAAAVFFHIADHSNKSQRIALDDYQDEIETMDRVLGKIKNLNLSNKDKMAMTKITNNWSNVKAMSEEIIKIDAIHPEISLKLRQYWFAVEALDQLIDKEIYDIEGEH